MTTEKVKFQVTITTYNDAGESKIKFYFLLRY